MNGEQPLVADLHAMPTAADACLVCTNLRYLNGRKPTFTDAIESTFLIPLGMLRFVELPKQSVEPAAEFMALGPGLDDDTLDMDAEAEAAFLRRIREA